jgi:hypothetical protein
MTLNRVIFFIGFPAADSSITGHFLKSRFKRV